MTLTSIIDACQIQGNCDELKEKREENEGWVGELPCSRIEHLLNKNFELYLHNVIEQHRLFLLTHLSYT